MLYLLELERSMSRLHLFKRLVYEHNSHRSRFKGMFVVEDGPMDKTFYRATKLVGKNVPVDLNMGCSAILPTRQ